MDNTMQPLVLTPKHHPTESLLGYVLHVSEKNGYESPWQILDHAGITRREALSPLFPIDKLSKVLDREPVTLQHIAYSRKADNGSLQFQILSQNIGQATRARTYRLSKLAFCPKCVLEKGFIEAHWDIDMVTACPRHACKLLVACPSCGKTINYFRQGLLRCECGQDWTDVECAPADPEVVDIQSILISKILGQSVAVPCTTGMPVEQMEALPLNCLMAAIEIIGKYTLKGMKSGSHTRDDIVSSAATTFSNWPVNYENVIKKLIDIGGGWSLKHFLNALSRAGILEEQGNFLRDPINRHLAALPPLHKRSLRPAKPTAATKNAGAKIKQLCQPDRNSIGERRAAAFLQIPVSALNALRASGHYKVLNVPTPLRAYHLNDLKCFLQEVLACVPNSLPGFKKNKAKVTLGYVLQEFRFHTKTGKPDLIAAILSGRLVPIGRTGDTIPDIILNRTDVEAFLISTRTKAEGNTASQSDAAAYLDCDPLTIPGLSNGGYIVSVSGVGRSRITLDSLENFKNQYASLSTIANINNTSSCKLISLCEKNSIPTLAIQRKGTISSQPFIKREYCDRLNEIIAHSNDDANCEPRLSSVNLIRLYLNGLRQKGKRLPRRAGMPNKAAIAKACGFDRNTLYLNKEVMKILDAFEIEDRQRNNVRIKNDDMSELRRYLDELKRCNHPLPCRAGKPNKVAIANSGRFNRNVFYDNSEAIKLIEEFEIQ